MNRGRRTGSWLKIKNLKTADYVVFGYTRGEGYRASTFGSLVVGLYDEKSKPVYVANVGTGFDQSLLEALHKQLQSIAIDAKAPLKLKITMKAK